MVDFPGKIRLRRCDALLVGLGAERLDDFAVTMDRRDGQVVKDKLADRQVHRLVLEDGNTYFLKRVFATPLLEAWKTRFGFGAFHSRPGREWLALERLKALDVPAATGVICAEHYLGGVVRQAYLLTQGLPVCLSLEELLRNHGRVGETEVDLQCLAVQVADILKTMHQGGVNHRDFYLGHLFLGNDLKTVYVMDLDRADCRDHVGTRWRIKDLAALHFSTPLKWFSVFARLRFLRRYLGVNLSGARDLVAEIDSKARSIRAHVKRKIAQGNQNYHVNE